jgi:phosphatidylinositol alpha-1,6-mannosyltransferase
MKKIKKSLLLTLDFPPKLGGVATYYYNICKNLPPNSIVVVAPYQVGCEKFDSQQSFPIIRRKELTALTKVSKNKLVGLANSIRWISFYSQLAKIIKQHDIEILQVGQILPLGTLALMHHKKTDLPYLVYSHGLDITSPQAYPRKKTLLKNIIKKAEYLVANSYFTKDELIKLGAQDHQVTVIYPCAGVEVRDISQAEVSNIIKKNELQNKKILLSVGRLVERKGFDMVIKSLKKIIPKVPDIAYVIVGDGPDKKRLEMITALEHMGEYVHFAGAVSDIDLSAYYSSCEALIMPSRRLKNGDVEGFGIVYLDANSYGKPAIGGRSGGAPEAISHGETGLLVDPTDIQSIADAVIRLLTDEPYANRLGLQGMNRVSTHFEWDSQVEKIKDLLN